MKNLLQGFRLTTRRRCRRGLTLLELLIVLGMTVVIAGALSMVFSAEVSLQRSQETMRAGLDQTEVLQRRITNLLAGARLSGVSGDTTTYFQGLADGGSVEVGSDRLTFTTAAPSIPLKAVSSTDDFETQQTATGPVGGLAEVSLGTVAVGNPGVLTGLFQRIQRPSDADPTQGGMESVLDSDVASMGFQFWDGQNWVDTWDTTTMTPPRLPQAVQVSYHLTSEPNGPVHLFVVPIPASDVTSLNPVTASTTTTAATPAAGAGG